MDTGSYSSRSTGSNPRCGGRLISGHLACVVFFIAFFLIIVAMVSPDWLAVNEAVAPKNTKFQKLGLWMSCYKDLHDLWYYDPYLSNGYQGCRWIYYPVVASFYDLKEYVLPGFIVPVQISFTLCFVGCLISLVLVLTYLVKFTSRNEGLIHFLIALGMLMNMAALVGEVAVIVFGSLAGSRTWAEPWQFNYLSWAFIVGVVGVVLLHLAGILFLVEGLRQWKKRRDRAGGMGMYNVSHAPSQVSMVKHP